MHPDSAAKALRPFLAPPAFKISLVDRIPALRRALPCLTPIPSIVSMDAAVALLCLEMTALRF